MSRFIQNEHKPKPKESKPIPKPKPGTYTSKELEDTKKIHSGNGGKY